MCAGSTAQLAHLEAVVASSSSMRVVSSTLGISALHEELAETEPDVLLEQLTAGDSIDSAAADGASDQIPAVLLVAESEYATARDILRNRESSVRAILPDWASDEEIEIAIKAAARGLIVLHPEIGLVDQEAEDLAASVPGDSNEQPLSPRESEILQLLAAGLGNKEIAWRLKISEHTVKFHVTSIFNKLNTSSRAEAVAIGMRRGLIAL